jgi:hypothetical protein
MFAQAPRGVHRIMAEADEASSSVDLLRSGADLRRIGATPPFRLVGHRRHPMIRLDLVVVHRLTGARPAGWTFSTSGSTHGSPARFTRAPAAPPAHRSGTLAPRSRARRSPSVTLTAPEPPPDAAHPGRPKPACPTRTVPLLAPHPPRRASASGAGPIPAPTAPGPDSAGALRPGRDTAARSRTPPACRPRRECPRHWRVPPRSAFEFAVDAAYRCVRAATYRRDRPNSTDHRRSVVDGEHDEISGCVPMDCQATRLEKKDAVPFAIVPKVLPTERNTEAALAE